MLIVSEHSWKSVGWRRLSVRNTHEVREMSVGNMKESRSQSRSILFEQCPNLRMRRDVILHSTENPDGGLIPVTTTALVVTQQAESDQHLIDLWVHGRSRHTQRAYRGDAEKFIADVDKPLRRITLGDL